MLSHGEHFYSLFLSHLRREEWLWTCLESLELGELQGNFSLAPQSCIWCQRKHDFLVQIKNIFEKVY